MNQQTVHRQHLPIKILQPCWSHLREVISSKMSVLDDRVGETTGSDVTKSLDFVDDSICIRHLCPIFRGWEKLCANYSVTFCLKLL